MFHGWSYAVEMRQLECFLTLVYLNLETLSPGQLQIMLVVLQK